jgi:hypothetical protein
MGNFRRISASAALGLALFAAAAARTVTVKGMAPAGSRVSVGGLEFPVDSSGHWIGSFPVDSAGSSREELCLLQNGDRVCTGFDPGAYDTVELAPLAFAPGKTDTGTSFPDVFPDGGDPAKAAPIAALPETGSAQVVDGGREADGRTVKVRAKRKPQRASGQTRVTSQEIKRMPGLAEPDVIRAVQALPGVVASSDFSTKLYVRGSSSDQNLVLFDDAVVYSPMHFGGIFSTFLADSVGGMEF